MKVKVEKISHNENTYRTPLMDLDQMRDSPQVGRRLLLESSVHESGGILTSEVVDILKTENGFEVKTLFSTYIITVLGGNLEN